MEPSRYEAWYHTEKGAWISQRETALMLRLLRPDPGMSLLDVGSGTGHSNPAFLKTFPGADFWPSPGAGNRKSRLSLIRPSSFRRMFAVMAAAVEKGFYFSVDLIKTKNYILFRIFSNWFESMRNHDLLPALKALAHETRLNMVELLLSQSLCVGALATRLGISEAAASQHLQVLRKAGLVRGEKQGYWTHYAVQTDVLARLGQRIGGLPDQREDLRDLNLYLCAEGRSNHKKGGG